MEVSKIERERRPGRKAALGSDPDRARERVLEAFASRARQVGIRSVVMGELASELHISASTLYRQFSSKADLVAACVERWAEDLSASAALDYSPSVDGPRAVAVAVEDWGEAWSDAVSRYSAAWWRDLRRGYPESWATFDRALRAHKQRGAAVLRPYLRQDIHAGTALTVLELILDRLPSADLCDRLGVTRREAIRTAIAVWARGALDDRMTVLQPTGPRQ